MRPVFHLLSDTQRTAIANAAFELLEQTGVVLTEPEALALLDGAGAHIEGDRVKLPAYLVEQAIQSAPSPLPIYTRDGQEAMMLGGRSAYFGAHTDAPDVLDPYTHQRRECREDDVRRNVILIDALPQISYTTASGLVSDRPDHVADRVSLSLCLIHSPKPVLSMPVTLAALRDCHHIAAEAVGGEEALRQKPVMVVYAEPVSPLLHPDDSIKRLLYSAEHQIPLIYSPYAAMGATAPMSRAAIITQLCAETLSGLVVHQLKQPGAPYIFGGMASVMDMKTTIFSYGAPEFQAGNSLMAEMAHHFDLPNFGTAGTSDAQTFDGQAIAEATSSCLMAHLTGANLIHDVGLLGNATVVMPEMIVATNEIIGMIRHLLAGVPVEKDDLALDLIDEVGPGGQFVTHQHTLKHFRETWYPGLFYRKGAKGWADSEPNFEQQVNQRTREIIDTHQSDRLSDDRVERIQAIVLDAEAKG